MIIKRKKFLEKPEKIKQEPVPQIEPEPPIPQPPVQEDPPKVEQEPDIFDGFDFQDIDFSQRSERRRGDRRRGYRRIDDRNLISRAQEEAIIIKEASSKEGYEAGFAKAEEEISELQNSLQEFYSYKEAIFEKVSSDILDIALDVAEKIIKREVASDKTILSNIVNDALENLAKGENKIILKVAPVDVEYAKDMIPELLSTGQTEAKIYVTADKTVVEGGVIIETSNGLIDANISTQLGVIREAFKKISAAVESDEDENRDEEEI